MIETYQWTRVLQQCGVMPGNAMTWGPVFAKYVQPESFNLGGRELDGFVGQVLAETGALSTITENLNYSANRIREIAMKSRPGSRWRSLAPIADKIANKPQAFAEAVYGGRMGNDAPGDGWRYRGGGIPMVTGKDNYRMLALLTGLPLVEQPELLREPDTTMRCGVLWWEENVPDSAIDSIERESRAVNGGTIGLEHRTRYTLAAQKALAGLL